MALGSRLTSPLSGFKRIDDRDSYITYETTGSIVKSTHSNNFNSTFTTIPANQISKIKFNFTGSSVKILGNTSVNTGILSIRVYLDSETIYKTYSVSASSTTMLILFEIDDLEVEEHSLILEFFNPTIAVRMDAVDILTGSSLKTYKLMEKKTHLLIKQEEKFYGLKDNVLSESSVLNKDFALDYSSPSISASAISKKNYFFPFSEIKDNLSVIHLSKKPLSIESSKRMAILINGISYVVNNGNLEALTDVSLISSKGFYSLNLNNTLYNQIGDNFSLVVYSSNMKSDILVETKVEPFFVWDEIKGEVEIFCYTNHLTKNEARLEITANYSPLDELNGNYDILILDNGSTKKGIEITGVPQPKLIPSKSISDINTIAISDLANKSNVRILLSKDGEEWFKWNGSDFEIVTLSNSNSLYNYNLANTVNEISSITNKQILSKWNSKNTYIGILINDGVRDSNTVSNVGIEVLQLKPTDTSIVEKLMFYILNTTAKIDVKLQGNTILGTLSDDDLTRVRYRVFLNQKPLYPANGEFTELHSSPSNIKLPIDTSKVLFQEENRLKIEFEDYFGSTDTWEFKFIGDYSGLMFKDVHGEYFSSDFGEILKKLDFKTLVAGEETVSHEISIKNSYGYDIKDVSIYVDDAEFPTGLEFQFSRVKTPFKAEKSISYEKLKDMTENIFYIKLVSDVNTRPNGLKEFDIIATAEKDESESL